MRKRHNKFYTFVISSIALFLGMIFEFTEHKLDYKCINKKDFSYVFKEPTIQHVYLACELYGIINPEIVVAQSIIETDNYKQYRGNNIFNLYDSKKGEYYKFEHWTESVEMYGKKIEKEYIKNKDKYKDYYQFLEELPYLKDTAYISKIKKIRKDIY